MYKFELHLINMNTAQNETIKIGIDETPIKIGIDETLIECTEKDIFMYAMSKAYDYVNSDEKYMFDSLEFISC